METVVKVEHVSKQYNYGVIGTGTLNADVQSWWAKARGKEDPNTKVGTRHTSGSFYALNDVSFEVKKGEALGIIGYNGAGKSTLLKILSRITAPTAGEIFIQGKIASMLEVGTGFHPELTGMENIYMNGSILGMSRAEIDAKRDEIIAFSEVEDFINTPVKRYSSGMYVRLAFSVAAHLDSDIMILDEVLAVGDARFQEKCIKKMSSILHDEGRTILFVSHRMSAIRRLCTRGILLEEGRNVFDGDIETAAARYLSKQQAGPGEAAGDDAAGETLEITRVPMLSQEEVPALLGVTLVDGGAVVSEGDPLVFTLAWAPAQRGAQRYRLRASICYYDGSPVGVSLSEPFEASGASQEQETSFALPTDRLARGDYFFNFEVLAVSSEQRGIGSQLLVVDSRRSFSVSDEAHKTPVEEGYFVPKGPWNHMKWGHVVFSPTRVLK